MPGLPVVSGAQAVKAFSRDGWRVDRQKGSHVIMVKAGSIASLSVPQHKELAPGTLRPQPDVPHLAPAPRRLGIEPPPCHVTPSGYPPDAQSARRPRVGTREGRHMGRDVIERIVVAATPLDPPVKGPG